MAFLEKTKLLEVVVIVFVLRGCPFKSACGISVTFSNCDQMTNTINVTEGNSYSFVCHIPYSSGRLTNCKWLVDGDAVTNDVSQYSTSCDLRNYYPTRDDLSKLVVCELEVGDVFVREDCKMNVLYPPNITAVPNRSIIEGVNLAIKCQSVGNPPPTYSWNKTGDCKFNQSGQMLTLNSIRRVDAGTYTCLATNILGRSYYHPHCFTRLTNTRQDTETVTIDVLYPPTVTPMCSKNIFIGSRLTVNCNANGNPSPTYRWTKVGDSNFRLPGSVLTLNNIQPENAGTYSCYAENSMRPTDSSSVTTGSDTESLSIDVLFPPTISALSDRYITLGESLMVFCQATGNPSPTFRWTKEGNGNFNQSGPRLTLLNTVPGTIGTYVCHAESDIGSDTEQLTVGIILSPPTKPSNFTYISKTLTDKTVTVVWVGGSSQGLSQNFTLNVKELSSEKEQVYYIEEESQVGRSHGLYVYNIDELMADTEYMFNLSSSNSMGNVDADDVVILKTKQSLPSSDKTKTESILHSAKLHTNQSLNKDVPTIAYAGGLTSGSVGLGTLVGIVLGVVLCVSSFHIIFLLVILRRNGISFIELLKKKRLPRQRPCKGSTNQNASRAFASQIYDCSSSVEGAYERLGHDVQDMNMYEPVQIQQRRSATRPSSDKIYENMTI